MALIFSNFLWPPFGSLAFAMKIGISGAMLLDTSRESTETWPILGVCVCPESW